MRSPRPAAKMSALLTLRTKIETHYLAGISRQYCLKILINSRLYNAGQFAIAPLFLRPSIRL